jgi:hypothetical protein
MFVTGKHLLRAEVDGNTVLNFMLAHILDKCLANKFIDKRQISLVSALGSPTLGSQRPVVESRGERALNIARTCLFGLTGTPLKIQGATVVP